MVEPVSASRTPSQRPRASEEDAWGPQEEDQDRKYQPCVYNDTCSLIKEYILAPFLDIIFVSLIA